MNCLLNRTAGSTFTVGSPLAQQALTGTTCTPKTPGTGFSSGRTTQSQPAARHGGGSLRPVLTHQLSSTAAQQRSPGRPTLVIGYSLGLPGFFKPTSPILGGPAPAR